jgi:lysozyme
MTRIADLIERHEGKRTRPYTDTVGKLTVGIGRNISDVPFSKDEIYLVFRNDVAQARRARERLFPTWVELSAVPQAVLLDIMDNMGSARIRGSRRTRRALRRQGFENSAVEMLDSKWAGQVGKKTHQ